MHSSKISRIRREALEPGRRDCVDEVLVSRFDIGLRTAQNLGPTLNSQRPCAGNNASRAIAPTHKNAELSEFCLISHEHLPSRAESGFELTETARTELVNRPLGFLHPLRNF